MALKGKMIDPTIMLGSDPDPSQMQAILTVSEYARNRIGSKTLDSVPA